MPSANSMPTYENTMKTAAKTRSTVSKTAQFEGLKPGRFEASGLRVVGKLWEITLLDLPQHRKARRVLEGSKLIVCDD